jgi:hypothetical protein
MDSRLRNQDFQIGNVCSVLRFVLPIMWMVCHFDDGVFDEEVINEMINDLGIPASGKVFECIFP